MKELEVPVPVMAASCVTGNSQWSVPSRRRSDIRWALTWDKVCKDGPKEWGLGSIIQKDQETQIRMDALLERTGRARVEAMLWPTT